MVSIMYKKITFFLIVVSMFFASALFLHGCFTGCYDIGCVGGFRLKASYKDNSPLTKGEYIVHLTVEKYKFDVKCEITDLSEKIACEFIKNMPEDWLILVMMNSEYVDDIKKGYTEIYISIADASDSHGDFSAITGPDFVQINIENSGKIIGEGTYHPEYDRDYDYFGDERCGYCDSLVEEHLVLDGKDGT